MMETSANAGLLSFEAGENMCNLGYRANMKNEKYGIFPRNVACVFPEMFHDLHLCSTCILHGTSDGAVMESVKGIKRGLHQPWGYVRKVHSDQCPTSSKRAKTAVNRRDEGTRRHIFPCFLSALIWRVPLL